mgnify:CR=1 FL=1
MYEVLTPMSLNDQSAEKRAVIARRTGNLLKDETLAEVDRRAAEVLARQLAEDTIEHVRIELVHAIKHCRFLPKDLALKIAHDVDSVACPFLEVTEVFSEADWQQLILTISRSARIAVARRSSLSESTAVALLKDRDTVVAEALVENRSASMTTKICDTLLRGFRSEVWILERLALREDLSMTIAVTLAAHVSKAVGKKLTERYELEDYTSPLVADAETAAILRAVKEQHAEDLIGAVKSLKQNQKLTAALMLAAIREEKNAFLEAALSVSAERSIEHVRSVLYHADQSIVEQLLQSAHIPSVILSDFWTAVKTLRNQ